MYFFLALGITLLGVALVLLWKAPDGPPFSVSARSR